MVTFVRLAKSLVKSAGLLHVAYSLFFPCFLRSPTLFNPYRGHKSRRRAICNMFNAFIPFVQTSTTARMIHVCIVEPALIDSIVSTAVVRLDSMVLDVKMYLVRLTQPFNRYKGNAMGQLQRLCVLTYIRNVTNIALLRI